MHVTWVFLFFPSKKLNFQHNELNVQEQGMGGTVYDRDTIMKKYMNGYDGKTLGHKQIMLLLQRHGIVKTFVCLYMQPGCQILLIGVTRVVWFMLFSYQNLTYACMCRTRHIYR